MEEEEEEDIPTFLMLRAANGQGNARRAEEREERVLAVTTHHTRLVKISITKYWATFIIF